FFFQAEDGIRDDLVTGVQTCALPILIADGIHVSPPLFRLLHRALHSGSIFYTTDAMAAAGAGPGRYTIGHLQVEVGADQIVRQRSEERRVGKGGRVDGRAEYGGEVRR